MAPNISPFKYSSNLKVVAEDSDKPIKLSIPHSNEKDDEEDDTFQLHGTYAKQKQKWNSLMTDLKRPPVD